MRRKIFIMIYFFMLACYAGNVMAAAPKDLNDITEYRDLTTVGAALQAAPDVYRHGYRPVFYDDTSPSIVSHYTANLLKCPVRELIDAINRKNLGEVITALQAGANVNKQDGVRRTPLHLAAELNLERIALELIRHGADINALCISAESPLECAVRCDSVAVVRLLLRHGAQLKTWHYNIVPDILKKDAMASMLISLVELPRRLALCEGLHPRLNAQSRLKELDQEIIRHIAQYTNIELYVDVQQPNPSQLRKIYHILPLREITGIVTGFVGLAVLSGVITYYFGPTDGCPSCDPFPSHYF